MTKQLAVDPWQAGLEQMIGLIASLSPSAVINQWPRVIVAAIIQNQSLLARHQHSEKILKKKYISEKYFCFFIYWKKEWDAPGILSQDLGFKD